MTGIPRLFLAAMVVTAVGATTALAQANVNSPAVTASVPHKVKVASRQGGRSSDTFPRASSPRNSEDPPSWAAEALAIMTW